MKIRVKPTKLAMQTHFNSTFTLTRGGQNRSQTPLMLSKKGFSVFDKSPTVDLGPQTIRHDKGASLTSVFTND